MKKVGTCYSKSGYFTDKEVLSILGDSRIVHTLLNRGSLDTEISLSDGYMRERYLGSRVDFPKSVAGMFRLLADELRFYKGYTYPLYMSIEDCGTDIKVSMCFKDSSENVEVVFIDTTSDSLRVREGVGSPILFRNNEELLNRLVETLDFCSGLYPSLHGISYWLSKPSNTYGLVGRDYYLGFTKANIVNGVDVNGCIEDEYMLAFVEMVEVKEL